MARPPGSGPRAEFSEDRERLQTQTADLAENVTRLTQACTAAMAEAMVGSVQVFTGLVTDVAAAFARPMQVRPEDSRAGAQLPCVTVPDVAEIVNSTDRAVRNAADVVERTQRRFSETYQPPVRHEPEPPAP
jgi:hypothetical protein